MSIIFFEEFAHKKLNQDEEDICDDPLTKEECLKTLNEMECNKTTGSDDLPAKFYRICWNDISNHPLNSFNYVYFHGKLSVSQKRGIIKLIPKRH